MNGEDRPVDDFLPRAKLKKLYADEKTSGASHKELEKFSKEFAVEKMSC